MQISVVVDDKGQVEATRAKLATALGRGAQIKTPEGFATRWLSS